MLSRRPIRGSAKQQKAHVPPLRTEDEAKTSVFSGAATHSGSATETQIFFIYKKENAESSEGRGSGAVSMATLVKLYCCHF